MKVKTLTLGEFQTNCFCVQADAKSRECVIIDTGMRSEPLIDYLRELDLRPEAVLFTHGHADHFEGLGLVRERYPDINTVIHKDDAGMLTDPVANVSAMLGMTITTAPADIVLQDEEPIEFAGIRFEVLHTPGHTPGGVCYYVRDEAVLFAGDTLFNGSVGRTDFPGGDMDQLIAVIRTKLLTLPDETIVYCGHGPATTIGAEKQGNPFL